MRKTFTFVFAIHMIALLYFIISADMQKVKKRSLQVRTIAASPNIPLKKQASTPQSKSKNVSQGPAKQSAPNKNRQPQRPSIQKKQIGTEKKKSEPSAKKEAVSHLLQELEETIAKIDQKRDKDSPLKQIETPSWIKPLKIDAIKEIGDDDIQVDFTYQESLIRCLRESLDLPELGEVKMEITLSKDGSVLKLRVLATESEKNRSYLEKNLQVIKFPPFDVNEDSRKTFVLTFCNEV